MKRTIISVAAIVLGGLLAVWAQPNGTEGDPVNTNEVGRIAQEQNTEVFYLWPSTSEFVIDPNNTVLPLGFNVIKKADAMQFHLISTDPNITSAYITVIRESTPGGVLDWGGPKIKTVETIEIQWIVYRKNMDPFFSGFGDILLFPSDPIQ